MAIASQQWNELNEMVKQECLNEPVNDKVMHAVLKNLGLNTTPPNPNNLCVATRDDVWKVGMRTIIDGIRCRQRSALKNDVLRRHAIAGGKVCGKANAPFAKSNMVGPSARAAVHGGIAGKKMSCTWDMVFAGVKVKNMTWDIIEDIFNRFQNIVIGNAATAHYLRELQSRLKVGSSRTVAKAWRKDDVDKLWVKAHNHANTVVKKAI